MKRFRQCMTGNVNKGFQGHIRYTMQLPEQVKRVRLVFQFDKREPEQDLEQMRQASREALMLNAQGQSVTEEMLRFCEGLPKGEINVSMTYNGAVVGCMHRNLLTKEAVVGPDQASEGFQATRFTGGILEVTLHCLHIVNDGTSYELVIEEA